MANARAAIIIMLKSGHLRVVPFFWIANVPSGVEAVVTKRHNTFTC